MKSGRRIATFSLLFLVLHLALARGARAGYKALLRDLEGYQPPAVAAGPMTARPAPTAVEQEPAGDTFQDQVAALRERQGEWIKALAEPQAEDSFLLPAPALMQALGPAAKDPALAAKALAGTFTKETLEALALLRSPTVQAREDEFRAVLEGYSQVEDLDTILRRYASFTKSVMTGVGGMSNPDPAGFKFPFPGVLALKGEVVGQEALAAREELEASRREAVTTVRRDHAELLYLHRALSVSRAQLQLLTSLRRAVATRYEAGSSNFQDLTAIDIEQEKVREGVTTLGEERKNSEAAIRAALLLPESTVIGTPVPAKARGPVKLEALSSLALARRQELRGKRAEIGRTERMLALAETMIYPGFSQGLTLFEGDEVSRIKGEGPQPEEDKGGMAGGEGSFPLSSAASTGVGLPKAPWFGTDDAYLRQTRQRIAALKQELKAAEAATLLGVRQAWFSLDKAQREKTLYAKRVLPLAKASLDSSTQGYSAGGVGFSELIRSATGWLEANLALARVESDLLVAQAELDAAVGVSAAGARP